jgi:hypothetical protein
MGCTTYVYVVHHDTRLKEESELLLITLLELRFKIGILLAADEERRICPIESHIQSPVEVDPITREALPGKFFAHDLGKLVQLFRQCG